MKQHKLELYDVWTPQKLLAVVKDREIITPARLKVRPRDLKVLNVIDPGVFRYHLYAYLHIIIYMMHTTKPLTSYIDSAVVRYHVWIMWERCEPMKKGKPGHVGPLSMWKPCIVLLVEKQLYNAAINMCLCAGDCQCQLLIDSVKRLNPSSTAGEFSLLLDGDPFP